MDLLKNYNLEHVIGQGAFSKVIICTHKITGEKAAIKVVDRRGLNGEEELRCIERERLIAPLLKHPNIVGTASVVEIGKYFQFFMEYCPNGDLLSYVMQSAGGRLPEAEARRIFVGIVSSLDYLHRNGFVHRDVKLENILLDGNWEPKLADFGFSTRFNIYGFSKLTEYPGTISYSAPEIVGGIPYVGPEVDIWSLGVVLYAMVAGSRPFSGQHITSRIQAAQVSYPSTFSPELVELLKAIFRVHGRDRPSAKQLLSFAWIQDADDADELSKMYEDNHMACVDTPRSNKSHDDETPPPTNRNKNSRTTSKSWGNLPDMRSELPFVEVACPVLLMFGEKTKQMTSAAPEEPSNSLTATILDHLGTSYLGGRKCSIGERPYVTIEEIDKEGAGEEVCPPSIPKNNKLPNSSPSTGKKKSSGSTIVRRPSFFSSSHKGESIPEIKEKETSPVTRPRSRSMDSRPDQVSKLTKCATVLHLKKEDKTTPPHSGARDDTAKPVIKDKDDKDDKDKTKTKRQRKKGSMIAFFTQDKTPVEATPRSRPLSLTLPKFPEDQCDKSNNYDFVCKKDSATSTSSNSSNFSIASGSPDVTKKVSPTDDKKSERTKDRLKEKPCTSSEKRSLSKWIKQSIF